MNAAIRRARALLGIELAPVSHAERLIAATGAFLAIAVMIAAERGLLGDLGAALLVASMGATAVLLFAVPHGALSQPWPVLCGHGLSAVLGVLCARIASDPALAAGLAVGLATLAMHYARAIHPPGGATALTAVVGGPQVHALGFDYVLMPVLLNAMIMVALAVAINAAFHWRRYPAGWGRAKSAAKTHPGGLSDITHADFLAGLTHIGTFVDIGEDDFLTLRDAMHKASVQRMAADEEVSI